MLLIGLLEALRNRFTLLRSDLAWAYSFTFATIQIPAAQCRQNSRSSAGLICRLRTRTSRPRRIADYDMLPGGMTVRAGISNDLARARYCRMRYCRSQCLSIYRLPCVILFRQFFIAPPVTVFSRSYSGRIICNTRCQPFAFSRPITCPPSLRQTMASSTVRPPISRIVVDFPWPVLRCRQERLLILWAPIMRGSPAMCCMFLLQCPYGAPPATLSF